MQKTKAFVKIVRNLSGEIRIIIAILFITVVLHSQYIPFVSAQALNLPSGITINGLSFDSVPSQPILQWITHNPILHQEVPVITPVLFTQNLILPSAFTISPSTSVSATPTQSFSTPTVTPTATITPTPTIIPPTPTETPDPTTSPTPLPTTTPIPTVDASSDAVWDQLAACESGGNWHDNTGNGYYGGLQFSQGAWNSVGGSGSPADASREDQIAYGKKLQAIRGWGAWGACAKKLGLD